MRLMRRRRPDLSAVLAPRIVRVGDLVELIQDAVLRQDMRWLQDQQVGRPSVV